MRSVVLLEAQYAYPTLREGGHLFPLIVPRTNQMLLALLEWLGLATAQSTSCVLAFSTSDHLLGLIPSVALSFAPLVLFVSVFNDPEIFIR